MPPGSANKVLTQVSFNLLPLYLDFKSLRFRSRTLLRVESISYNSLALPNISPDVCFKSRHPRNLPSRCRTPRVRESDGGLGPPHSLRRRTSLVSHSSVCGAATLGSVLTIPCLHPTSYLSHCDSVLCLVVEKSFLLVFRSSLIDGCSASICNFGAPMGGGRVQGLPISHLGCLSPDQTV